MAELSSRDRLQPSLLDRLIDHEPGKRTETLEMRVLTRKQLRAAVLRDLSWLLNATRLQPEPDSPNREEVQRWAPYAHAARSVVNFGIPAFAGVTLSNMNTRSIEREVTEAIKAFEPRIDPRTLRVEVNVDHRNHHNVLQLMIRGQMWSQPVPLELLLAADVDVETGATEVRDLRN